MFLVTYFSQLKSTPFTLMAHCSIIGHSILMKLWQRTAILAIAIMSIFIVLPGLVLCLFPFAFFQRFLNGLHCDVTPLWLFPRGFIKTDRILEPDIAAGFPYFTSFSLLLMCTIYGFTLNITYYSLGAVVMMHALCDCTAL